MVVNRKGRSTREVVSLRRPMMLTMLRPLASLFMSHPCHYTHAFHSTPSHTREGKRRPHPDHLSSYCFFPPSHGPPPHGPPT